MTLIHLTRPRLTPGPSQTRATEPWYRQPGQPGILGGATAAALGPKHILMLMQTSHALTQCIDNFDGADGPGRWQWQRVGIQALLSAGKPVSARPKPVRCQASSSVSLAFAPPRSCLPFDGGSCASLSLGQFSVSRVTVGASC